ncbi:SAM-dependent methyltransferase [Paenarthrobacter sp. Z7-10]|uniref:putative RNA methyltransferase n=1 Tax=Paenarthrobacter sp. Z7-10 TaxID=2787635 RepID=UPI0022A9DE08|nr:methyltransferase domain-containing protein [Paenarthrobacter sp. Z7-10]MCZ2404065.1 SAM-dependent methyltransferase [Paenarthrobacter sp. Z7-10]
MYPSAIAALLCPVCAESFCAESFRTQGPEHSPASAGTAAGSPALVCASGHTFDVAKQGYVNFLTGAGTSFLPDTAGMVAAREEFLSTGAYRPLADALATLVASKVSAGDLVLDAGTGTGYYLSAIQRAADVTSIGLDISKFALRRAARANPETVNLVWDVWRPLPIAANAVRAVVVIFAPRNAAEFARVLGPNSVLLVVTPLPGHLAEIADEAGLLGVQPDKQEALESSLAEFFTPVSHQNVEYYLLLGREDVARAAMMGPAGHHLDPEVLRARVAFLPEQTTVAAKFRISAFSALPAAHRQ